MERAKNLDEFFGIGLDMAGKFWEKVCMNVMRVEVYWDDLDPRQGCWWYSQTFENGNVREGPIEDYVLNARGLVPEDAVRSILWAIGIDGKRAEVEVISDSRAVWQRMEMR